MSTNNTPSAPGRPGLSFETYEQAYRELSSPEGEPPTQRQLRRYLGTGSNTTLAGYRRRIAEARQAEKLPPDTGSIDAQLMALVQQLAKQIALDEAQLAQDRVDEIQAEADQRIRIAETTMDKRLRDTALLEHRADTAEATVAEQRSALSAKDEKLAQIEAESQASRESVATLTQSLEDTRRQLATITRQHEMLQQSVEQSRREHKAESEQHQADRNHLQESLNESRTQLAAITEKHATLVSRLEARDQTIEKQEIQHQTLQQRLDQTITDHESSLVQIHTLQNSLSTAESQLSRETSELLSLIHI